MVVHGLFAIFGFVRGGGAGGHYRSPRVLDSTPRAALRCPQGAGADRSAGGSGSTAAEPGAQLRSRESAKIKAEKRPSLETLREEVHILCRESDLLCAELAAIAQELRERRGNSERHAECPHELPAPGP